jgi:ABC-type nitrate/sulfonate/bicarbonate transport system permease component
MSATADAARAELPPPSPPRPRRDRSTLLRRLIVPIVLVTLWVAVSEARLVRPIFLPPPWAVGTALEGMAEQLPGAILTTVALTVTGWALGVVIGMGLGLLMAYSRTARDVLGMVFDVLRPVPVYALIPLFILWFGVSTRAPQVAIIALGTSVILGVTTLEAVRNVPPIYVRAALTLGASRAVIYRTVIVPSILPHLIGAIRVAAAVAWGLDVAAEFMGSSVGLGYLIILQQTYLRTAGIVLLVAIYSVLAVILDAVIARVERRITGWTDRRGGVGIVASMVGSR